MGSTDRTRELFSVLIQRPTLSDQLLQRPPFKFIHDIVHETLRVSGYLDGLFTSDELDAATAGSSRDNKVAFLQKLIDALNVDGHLDDVKPAKIVAGREAEMTNLLLQSLATEAAVHAKEKAAAAAAVTKKNAASKSKASSSSLAPKGKEEEKRKSGGKKDRDKEKEALRSSSKHRSKEKEVSNKSKTLTSTADRQGQEKRKDKSRDAKALNEADKFSSSTDKERRKKRSDSISRHKTSSSVINNAIDQNEEHLQQNQPPLDELYKTDLHETRTTPVRESSGGTSKGGDDSGIAEMSAESERHEPDKYGTPMGGLSGTSDFIEVHPHPYSSSPTPMMVAQPTVRPGTAIGRPQTAIGRPGTAVARLAPPKPKKNAISTNINTAEDEKTSPGSADKPQQISLIMEENVAVEKEAENFLVAEDDEEPMLLGAVAAEGASVSNLLRQGDDHGALVNRIVENTRMLEEKHLQEDGPFVEAADEPDAQEQRRARAEIESVQRVLQRSTQHVQPLVRTMEFVADDFDTMLRELEECRKQSALLERKLQERSTGVSAEVVALGATLRSFDSDIRHVREQLARSSANVLDNERKFVALLDAAVQLAKN